MGDPGTENIEPVRRSGWLCKEGKRLKGRAKRFLVLDGSKLSHHVKENTPPTWELDSNRIRVALGERPFEFSISSGGRSVAFFAENQSDLVGWVSALKNASCSLEDFYVMGKQLGKGSYGEVFLGTEKLTGKHYAIKVIQKNPQNRKQKKFIERERTIMTTVHHGNIVRTVDVFDGPSQLAIVSEYMEGGELFDLIIASQFFTEDKARHIMRQILEGVQYLHSRNIVHRDIKPENVLCTGKTWPLEVKLTDFGLSNFLKDDGDPAHAMLLSHVGTSYYIAPEIVGKGGYGPAVDIWASGVVLYIMLCGRFPFWGKSDIEYMRSITRGPGMSGEGWNEVSDEGKAFLKQLLQIDPKRRLTAGQALSHHWLVQESPALNRKLSSINGMKKITSKNKRRLPQEPMAIEGQGKDTGEPNGVTEEKQTSKVTDEPAST